MLGLHTSAREKLNALASRKNALTPGQLDALLLATESDPDLHDLFVVLAWTGQRLVDAVMLKWGASWLSLLIFGLPDQLPSGSLSASNFVVSSDRKHR